MSIGIKVIPFPIPLFTETYPYINGILEESL
jgi:hypothetical protein